MDQHRAELEAVLVPETKNKNDVVSLNESTLGVDYIELVKKHLREITSLKAKLYDQQCRLTDMEVRDRETQSDLKDARALLEAVVSSNKKQETISPALSRAQMVAKTSNKRVRSPSLEVIETTSKRVKGTEEKSELVSLERGLKTEKRSQALIPYVSLPTRSSKIKVSESPNSKTNLISAKSEKDRLKKPLSEAKMPLSMSAIPTASSSTLLSPAEPASPSKTLVKLGKPDKKHADVFSLPQSVTDMYLQSAKTLEIAPPPLETEFPRVFLRISYGGSDQQFLQYIQPNMNPSGPMLRRLVFPMLDLNPSMPSFPGAPGLVFASRHEILSDPPWTVFCKRSKAKAVWLYLGEYECTLVGQLTAEQFRSQSPIVQKRWAELIVKKKKYDVYVAMRARIVLRRDLVIPIDDKRHEDEIIQAEVHAIKNGRGRNVSEQEIIAAFSNGDENVDIIRMACVKYDHVFANSMKQKFVDYNKPVISATKTEIASIAESKSNPSAKSRGPKKRRVSTPSTDDESNSDMSSSEEDLTPSPPRQQRQRRASRKLLESRG